jgi:hypothetical protein
MSRRRTAKVIVLLPLIALASGTGVLLVGHEIAKPCDPTVTTVRIGHEWVQLQDRGSAGKDNCDGPRTSRSALTLGLDCKVRTRSRVVTTVPPNRADGTCGKPD